MAKKFLVNDSPYTFKPLFEYYEVDEKILRSVLDDKKSELEWGIIESWEKGSIDGESAAKFTALMQSISLDAARYLAKHIDLRKELNVNSLLDVAGGSGCYSIAFSVAQEVKTIVLDLGPVCQVAESFISKSMTPKSSVLTYTSDMFREPFPASDDPKYGYQAVFFSNIIHDWDENANRMLLKKSFDALPSNGYIMIHEALLNEDGGPLLIALYSFDMAIISKGRQYTLNEISNLLTECGFQDVKCKKVYGIYSLIYAKKP